MANEQVKEQNLQHVFKIAYKLYLDIGVENVTKELIAKKSGLSRRTIDRYFSDKKDCLIKTAEWFLISLKYKIGRKFPETAFNGQFTGAELLRKYMEEIKELFLVEPRTFILYTEFKIFVYRNCEVHEQGYSLLANWMGNRNLRQKIYDLGIKDGSITEGFDINNEEEYFTESFFGFLANLALSYNLHNREQMIEQIDKRINNTIGLYTGEINPRY